MTPRTLVDIFRNLESLNKPDLHLYKKGGALLSLASLDEMKPNQGPQMWETGGVPNSKLPEESKYTAGKKPRKPRVKKQATA